MEYGLDSYPADLHAGMLDIGLDYSQRSKESTGNSGNVGSKRGMGEREHV